MCLAGSWQLISALWSISIILLNRNRNGIAKYLLWRSAVEQQQRQQQRSESQQLSIGNCNVFFNFMILLFSI